jgi:arylformamidase
MRDPCPLNVQSFLFALQFFLFSTCTLVAEIAPTHKHVTYGPHSENVLNVWLAESDKPTPVLVIIHGGGWIGGEMDETLANNFYLSKGISVVAIRYRLLDQAILPAPVMDAARAVQFVRHMAPEWNLDKDRIAVTGGSAGGCTSLWLALHDDLADPESEDPVSRESTKPICAAVSNAQTSIDPLVIREWLGDQVLQHGMIFRSVGAKSTDEMLANYERYRPLFESFSPINFLDANDPPLYMTYGYPSTLPTDSVSNAIHHPAFALELKKRADALGVPCIVSTKENKIGSVHTFVLEKLKNRN